MATSTTWLIFLDGEDRTTSFIVSNIKPVPGEGGCPENSTPQMMPLTSGDMLLENYKKAPTGDIADYDPQ